MPYRWTLTDLTAPYLGSEVLSKDPLGWDDGTYTIKRSEMYKGAFHEYSTELKFHCDGGGKAFVDAVYATNDIDGRIDVLVEYDCDGSGTYDTLFNGIINLAGYKTDGEYTTVTIEKSDLLTKLFSRDQINVDLETTTSIGKQTISAVGSELLTMPSMVVDLHDKWTIENGYNYSFSEVILGDVAFLFNHNAHAIRADIENTFDWVESNWIYNLENENTLGQEIVSFTGIGITSPITISYNVQMSGTYSDDESTGGGTRNNIHVKLYLLHGTIDDQSNNITFIELASIGGYSADNFSVAFDINQSGTFQISGGDKVWLVWNVSYDNVIGATINLDWDYNASQITFDTDTTYQTTTAKSFLIHEAFNQVVDAIADSNGNFYSDYFGRTDSEKHNYPADGCGSLLAITNGLNIREFPNRPVYCTFKDLFDDMDCIHNIGAGYVDGQIRVEPISYFFDNTTKIISLPLVNKYETKNDNSKYINKIMIGYQKWESEFHGGLDDVCAKHEYSTIINSVKGEYSKLCKYLASSYTIEFTRRKNIEYLETEDWRYDNDNFLIALDRTGYSNFEPEMYADSFSSGSGMTQLATAYNIRLTPKRMLLAHLNVITAGLQVIKDSISFVRGDGNTGLSVAKTNTGCQEDFSGQVLSENQNIQWNNGSAANITPIWLTEKYVFEYPLTYTQFKTIKANPYGYVEFYKFADDVKNGFIVSMEYKMKTGMTKFELLKANV